MQNILFFLSMSIKNVLLKHSYTPLFTFYCGCFLATMTELSRYNRSYGKSKLFTLWPFIQVCQTLLQKRIIIIIFFEAQMLGVILFFLTSLLEYNCFTMVCQFLLYNKVYQLYIYIYPHISSLLCILLTLHIPPLQVDTEHQADLPELCGCFPLLSILHLVVYICPCHSLTSSRLTRPPPRVLKPILYVCVFIPVLPLGTSEPFFFLFHIYVLAYGICFSLSYLLHFV